MEGEIFQLGSEPSTKSPRQLECLGEGESTSRKNEPPHWLFSGEWLALKPNIHQQKQTQ